MYRVVATILGGICISFMIVCGFVCLQSLERLLFEYHQKSDVVWLWVCVAGIFAFYFLLTVVMDWVTRMDNRKLYKGKIGGKDEKR